MKNQFISIVMLMVLTACEEPVNSESLQATWEDLIQEGFTPKELILKYQIDTYEADDPRRMQLIRAMEEEWNSAPVNENLDNKKITLTGFIVPLEIESNAAYPTVSEFLLVPFLGACIHVPPPPANQLVYVKMESPIAMPNDGEAFSVTGIMKTESVNNELAEAGYNMKGLSLETFSNESLNPNTE
ncbi:hypothetical protein A9Q81_14590 [Gammaproteobacteria bacterium 42_54_T18]|nr:hypothetical protein A9Q81_14590 [Gammaproteobacteria bacterium 42_54_T18]